MNFGAFSSNGPRDLAPAPMHPLTNGTGAMCVDPPPTTEAAPPSPSLRRRLAPALQAPAGGKGASPFTLQLGLDGGSTQTSQAPKPDGERIVMRFLRAPESGQKISKEKRRPGLSKVSVKLQPKPQFSTKALGQKPGQEAVDAASAADSKVNQLPDSGLVVWLKAGHANRPDTQTARNYLLLGPPFLGDHVASRKEKLRDAGAVWWKNPEKKEGCLDNKVRFGWYSAPNERVLERLLELTPSVCERSMCQKLAWVPRGSDTRSASLALTITQIIGEYNLHAKHKDREHREDAKAAQEAREQLQRERNRASGRAADGQDGIDRLRDQYGVTWSVGLAKAAACGDVLGPSTGISEVERVLRGLDLGVVDPQDVHAHRFVDPALRETHLARSSRPVEDDGAPSKDYNWEAPDAPVLMFGSKHAWTIPLPGDSEWDRDRDRERAPCAPAPAPLAAMRNTICEVCNHDVMAQFGDCVCGEALRGSWALCGVCGAMRRGGPSDRGQACACSGEGHWLASQKVLAAKKLSQELENSAMIDDDDDDGDPSIGGLVTAGMSNNSEDSH